METTTSSLETDAGSYQQRLARCFAGYGWIVVALGVVVAIPYFAFPDVRERILPLPALIAFARVPILAAAVVALRTWRLEARPLAVMETSLTLSVMALGSVPLAVGTRDLALDLSAVPWLLLLLALRVGMVRASTRRELLVSVAAAVPLMAAAVARTMHDDTLDRHHPAWVAIVVVALWSAAAVSVSSLSTRAFVRLRDAVKVARRLGPYTIQAKIGHGGMGTVYRAHHALLRRPAAIKLLRPRPTGELDFERFELEARHTSQLSHPNIVSVFDYGRTPDGGFYYVMEFLDGYNLQELVVRYGPVPVPRALHILLQVCSGISEAHELGLVHRDIKPANIIVTTRLTEPDVVKVVDFGLVRAANDEQHAHARSVVGTLGYMSPEALRGEPVDVAGDIYSLGAVAYFILTGREVFRADSDRELIRRHLMEQPIAPSRKSGSIPPEVDDVVLRCLEKETSARFQSVAQLRRALVEVANLYPYQASEGESWWRAHAIKQAPTGADGSNDEEQWKTLPIDLRRPAGDVRSTEVASPQARRAR